jgi:hypothetical protein
LLCFLILAAATSVCLSETLPFFITDVWKAVAFSVVVKYVLGSASCFVAKACRIVVL